MTATSHRGISTCFDLSSIVSRRYGKSFNSSSLRYTLNSVVVISKCFVFKSLALPMKFKKGLTFQNFLQYIFQAPGDRSITI